MYLFTLRHVVPGDFSVIREDQEISSKSISEELEVKSINEFSSYSFSFLEELLHFFQRVFVLVEIFV